MFIAKLQEHMYQKGRGWKEKITESSQQQERNQMVILGLHSVYSRVTVEQETFLGVSVILDFSRTALFSLPTQRYLIDISNLTQNEGQVLFP